MKFQKKAIVSHQNYFILFISGKLCQLYNQTFYYYYSNYFFFTFFNMQTRYFSKGVLREINDFFLLARKKI